MILLSEYIKQLRAILEAEGDMPMVYDNKDYHSYEFADEPEVYKQIRVYDQQHPLEDDIHPKVCRVFP